MVLCRNFVNETAIIRSVKLVSESLAVWFYYLVIDHLILCTTILLHTVFTNLYESS